MKVRERDDDLFLLVADGAKVSTEISQSRSRVNDGHPVGIGEHDLQAGGVAAESLKTRIANGNGSSRAVKLKPHKNPFFLNGNSRRASIKLDDCPL